MFCEVLMLNAIVCFFGPEECFSGEGWDRSLNSSVHKFYSLLWSRRLLSVLRLRLMSMVVTDPGCLQQ